MARSPEVSGQKCYYFMGIRKRLISLENSPAISTHEFIEWYPSVSNCLPHVSFSFFHVHNLSGAKLHFKMLVKSKSKSTCSVIWVRMIPITLRNVPMSCGYMLLVSHGSILLMALTSLFPPLWWHFVCCPLKLSQHATSNHFFLFLDTPYCRPSTVIPHHWPPYLRISSHSVLLTHSCHVEFPECTALILAPTLKAPHSLVD